MNNKNNPLVIRLADDIDDESFRKLYKFYCNYFWIILYVLYATSLLLPRKLFDVGYPSEIMSLIPKFRVEMDNFQAYPEDDIKYYLAISLILYTITIVAVFSAGIAFVRKGMKHPFSFAQWREIRYRDFVSPFSTAIIFLFFIPRMAERHLTAGEIEMARSISVLAVNEHASADLARYIFASRYR